MKDQKKEEWSKEELKRISKCLQKKLGPEYISYRPGFGNIKLSYVEGWLIMSLANQIFDFNGWSTEIKSVTIDYCDMNEEKKTYSVGVSVIAKVTLKDGTFREDVGFGSADNAKRKSDAFQKSKKEAATDAIKRALRQFGNALGNCCYDKEYLKDIKSVGKEKKIELNVSDLLRRDEKKKECLEDSFDMENYDLTLSDDSKKDEYLNCKNKKLKSEFKKNNV